MVRLFSALIIALGMFVLTGCQSTCNSQQPVAQPMAVNETTCCKQAYCDQACMHECKMQHITCPKKSARFHRRARKATTTTTAMTSDAQSAAAAQANQAAQQATQQPAAPAAQ